MKIHMKSITPEDRFWRQLGTARPFSTVEASLFICSLSEVDVDPLFALLRRRGIQRVDQNDAPIWLVIVDSMGDPKNRPETSWHYWF